MLTAYLEGQDENGSLFIKKEAVDVVLDLKNDDTAATGGALTIGSDAGTVASVNGKNGSKLDVLAKSTTVKVVVSLAAKDITDDITIELTATDFVGTISMTVNYKGETKTVSIPEDTASWLDVLKAAGWDNDYTARSGKVRLDSDWTKGETVGTITDTAFVTGGKVKDKLSVTFGCVEMGRAADTNTEFAGTDVIAWTAGTTAWTTQTTKYFMAPGEEITAVVDLSKVTATGGTAVAAGAAPSIAIGGATNAASVSANVTGLAVKTAADDDTAVSATTSWDATAKKVSIGGVAEDNVITAGKVTFTIVVGETADAGLTITTANPTT